MGWSPSFRKNTWAKSEPAASPPAASNASPSSYDAGTAAGSVAGGFFSPSSSNSAFGQGIQDSLAGSEAAYNYGMNDLSGQLAFNDLNTDYMRDYQRELAGYANQGFDVMNERYGNDRATLARRMGYLTGDSDLDQQLLFLEDNALRRQYPYLQGQQDLTNQMYDVDINAANRGLGYNQRELDLANRGFDISQGGVNRDLGTTQQLHGLQGQRFGLEGQEFGQLDREAEFRAEMARRAAESSAVTRGATNTSGYITDQEEIAKRLGFDKERVGRGRNELGIRTQEEEAAFQNKMGELSDQLQLINLGRDNAKLDFDQQQTDLTDKITKLGLSKRQDQMTYEERVAQLGDELAKNGVASERERRDLAEQIAQAEDGLKNIDLLAKQTGIDRQEMEYRTQNALDQLGLSNYVSTNQIYQAMVDLNAGRFNEYQQYLGDIFKYGGIGG